MKVILATKVKNLGEEGEVVDVASGYARNYLMPKGLAVEATKSGLKEVEKKQKARAEQEAKLEAEAKAMGEKIKASVIKVEAKAGEGGKLFGSITSQDLAGEVEKRLGFKLDKKKIELKEPLKTLGNHTVPVRLYKDFVVEMQVEVETAK